MFYRLWPFPVIELNNFPKGINYFDAYSFGVLILIKKNLTDDEKQELLRHEDTHCRQFFNLFPFHTFFYGCSKEYRLECELEAYYEQLRVNHNDTLVFDIMLAAQEIWSNYDISDIYSKQYVINSLLSKFGIPPHERID